MPIPTDAFDCIIYIPRQQPKREWIIAVCHTLWRHGMQFSTPHMFVGTWDEQVQTIPEIQPYSTKSLSGQIDEIVEEGFGSLTCFDRGVEFDLRFDMSLRRAEAFLAFSPEQLVIRERLPMGKIELSVRYPIIDIKDRLPLFPPSQVSPSAYLVPLYQNIHLAMTHWSEILCSQIHPSFAVGYYSTNSYAASESLFQHEFDVAMITALEHNQFPPLRDWLNSIYILYAPEHFMVASQIDEWISASMRWSRRLSEGGWIAYALPETYDDSLIQDFNLACAAILKQSDRARLPLARIYLQRALEIAGVIQHTNATTIRLLSQLTYMEQNPTS